jgi:hypothetical protein
VDATDPVISPVAFVVPTGCVIVSIAPRDDDNTAVAPETRLLFASRTVMVMIEVVVPSAVTVTGAALTLLLAADGAPAVNVTEAVCVTLTDPLTCALITAFPDVVEATVPVICPDAFVVPTGCVIASVAPRDEDNVTVAPVTRLLFASRTVTVIVDVVTPSAVRVAGAALTVLAAADGDPAVNVTVAVFVKLTVPFTTALITASPDVVDATVPVI